MVIFKLIVVWLAIGALVHVAMILKVRKTAHEHGAKFRFEFNLKCTLADIIAWPRFIIMVNDVLEQVKDAHKNDRLS